MIRYVIQGFGNVGAWAAEILAESGGKVTAVSDASGAIHNDKGIDIKALRQYMSTGKTLVTFPEAVAFDKNQLLTMPCDVSFAGLACGVQWVSRPR